MSEVMLPRWIAKLWADLAGYCWLQCPVCHENFAGFEDGRYGLMETNSTGRVTCRKPSCQAAAKQSNEAFGIHYCD